MKPILEIKSKTGVLHFRRWKLFGTAWFSVFLHGIYESDKDKHMHNHPWSYCSIIVKGEYVEEYLDGSDTKIRFRNSRPLRNFYNPKYWPQLFKFQPSTRFHKILKLVTPVVYSIVIARTNDTRLWGYNVDGKFIDNITYRELKNNGKLED